MIVLEQPSSLRLFLVMQGSIVPGILHKILAVAALSAAILALDLYVWPVPHMALPAIGVFGIALSLFLGFRNNAAYDRWWEARGLWGQLIGEARSLARQAALFAPDRDVEERIVTTAVAFAHLHRGALRGVDVGAELEGWVAPDEAEAMMKTRNPADAALRKLSRTLEGLDGFGRMTLSDTLSRMAMAQAGCERIATTPLPFVYSLLVRRTTYLYCFLLPFALADQAGWFTPLVAAIVAYVFFGLQAVTRELEQPFRNAQNGLPLDAMCRVIEISAAEALGRTAPDPLEPAKGVLT